MKKKSEGELNQGRVWFRKTDDGVLMGLTSLGIEETGSIERLELPVDGDEFTAKETLGAAEGTHGRVEIPAPFDCVVVEVNTGLQQDSSTLEDDPLEEGWIAKVQVLGEDGEEEDSDEDDEDSDDEEEEDDFEDDES